MEPSTEQYARVARWLDGEPLELSVAEKALAEEVARAEADFAGAFEVAPPSAVVEAAMRRALPAGRRRGVRLLRFVGPALAAAAAAAVLIAVRPGPTTTQRRGPIFEPSAYEVAEVYDEADANGDLDLIGSQLDQIQAELVAAPHPGAVDAQIDALQNSLDLFWLEDDGRWPDES
jgi:hypothetical protein